MAAPQLTFTQTGSKISSKAGYDKITVAFSSDLPYKTFECRATKIGTEYGVGKGTLIASFSATPAQTERVFDIYNEYLVNGDGDYRISLFAQGEDGSWNDNQMFIPSNSDGLITSDGKEFLCVR